MVMKADDDDRRIIMAAKDAAPLRLTRRCIVGVGMLEGEGEMSRFRRCGELDKLRRFA